MNFLPQFLWASRFYVTMIVAISIQPQENYYLSYILEK